MKSKAKTPKLLGNRKFRRKKKSRKQENAKTKSQRDYMLDEESCMPDTSGEAGSEGSMPNPAEIRVFSVGKSLNKIETFKILENPLEIG